MQFLSAIKPFIPQPHAFLGEDRNYNVGVTFVDDLGLTDRHNVSLRYVRNSEKLALECGSIQPDGTWKYVTANGTEHICGADKAQTFFEETSRRAEIAQNMMNKMEEANGGEIVDAKPVCKSISPKCSTKPSHHKPYSFCVCKSYSISIG